MTQYLRFCSITADGGAGTIDVSTFRCRFFISQGTMLTPSILKLEVSNLLPSTARLFTQKEYAHIKIDAGYQDGHGIIFQGNIVQAIYGRESPTDTLLTVYAADGDHGRVAERGDPSMGSPEFGDVLLVEGQCLLLIHASVLAINARVRRLPRVATRSNTSISKRMKSSTCMLL